MNRSFAEAGGAHDHRALVVLQRAGDDLGSRSRAAVDQHYHRDLQGVDRQVADEVVLAAAQIILRVDDELVFGVRDAAIGGGYQRPSGQEGGGNTDCRVEQAAGVVTQVEDEPLERAGLIQIGQMLDDRRSRVFLEGSDAQVAVLVVDTLGFHALDFDDFPRQREFDRLCFALADDGQLDLGLGFATHALDCIVQAHALDQFVVKLEDQIAGLDASAVRGRVLDRRNNFDQAILHADFDAQPTELALGTRLQILESVGVEVGRVRVEVGEHATDGMRDQFLVFDRLDIALLDGVEHLGEGAQFLDRQIGPCRLLGHGRKLQA